MRNNQEPSGLVLIIEDNRNISEMVGEYLESKGFEVDYAGDGLDGYRLAAENISNRTKHYVATGVKKIPHATFDKLHGVCGSNTQVVLGRRDVNDACLEKIALGGQANR